MLCRKYGFSDRRCTIAALTKYFSRCNHDKKRETKTELSRPSFFEFIIYYHTGNISPINDHLKIMTVYLYLYLFSQKLTKKSFLII